MRFNKIKYFIYILFIFSLTSCNIDGLLSILDEIVIENDHYGNNTAIEVERDIGDSIKLLDNAFNAKVDKNNNPLVLDNYNISNDEYNYTKRLNISDNVRDLEYCDYLTPTTGTINGLVIPVDFVDYPAKKIEQDTLLPDYQSVSSYYYNSSYGQLNMNFDVLGWQRLKNKSSYYERSKKYEGEVSGVSEIIYEVLGYLQYDIDLSKYDNDDDGLIDCLYIIYSRPYNSNSDFWWAFQYTTFENKEFDNLLTSYYVFASYEFLFEDNKECDTITYIHETGHMLGLEDYYDYDIDEGFNRGGLGAADMMDYNLGDHNPFSKLSLGWINNPLLIQLQENKSISINLYNYEKYGDVVMICDNYDATKGMFQDYFLLIYTDPYSLLNKNNTVYTKKGVRVYRIHGELKTYTDGGVSYKYFKYDNSYTNYNLIDSFINKSINPIYSKNEYQEICASDDDLFYKGNTCSNLFYYNQITSPSNYSFKVDSLNENYASITFYR